MRSTFGSKCWRITAPGSSFLIWVAYPPSRQKACKVFEINDLSWYFLFEKPKEGGCGEGFARFRNSFRVHECQVPSGAVLGSGGKWHTSMRVITRQSDKLVPSAHRASDPRPDGKTGPFRKRVTRITRSVTKMIFRQILCCPSYAIQC